MKLHWSSRSPYVRKVMVAAHELGLAGRLDCVRTVTALDKPNTGLMRDNPLSKIPTLVRDDGRPLYDSVVICEYLDGIDGRHRLFPAEPTARIETLRRHALGNGLLDLLLIRRSERDKQGERRSPEHLAAYVAKTVSGLDALEAEAPELARLPLDIGHIAIGCALSYMDFRFAADPWRPGRPQLTAWHEMFDARPSMVATRHVDA